MDVAGCIMYGFYLGSSSCGFVVVGWGVKGVFWSEGSGEGGEWGIGR